MNRIVIKIGSSFFINKNEINRENIENLINQIHKIQARGISCCLISSGAVAVGVKKMGFSSKPTDIAKKQACAAIGQMTLMQEYEQVFNKYNMNCAQILLNHDDFGNRNRILSMQKTINTLLQMKVVPVINENDALAVEEIKVGDNDTLSAMTSLVVDADLLVLVSDIDGLYTANPREDSSAVLISEVDKIDQKIKEMAGGAGTKYGTGGMSTKIKAGEIATSYGIDMMIVNKDKITRLAEVCDGENIGTLFKGHSNLTLKSSWVKFCANVRGKIFIDEGAERALKNRKSLLSCGIKGVEGSFKHGEVVEIISGEKLVAKGIATYDNTETKKLSENKDLKNHIAVHANNMVIIEE